MFYLSQDNYFTVFWRQSSPNQWRTCLQRLLFSGAWKIGWATSDWWMYKTRRLIMYYRCPVCDGKGLVEPNFGGPGTGTSKQCPACKGTGMQCVPEHSEPEIRIVKVPRREPLKVWPPDPFRHPPPIPRNPFDIPKPGDIKPYVPRYRCIRA